MKIVAYVAIEVHVWCGQRAMVLAPGVLLYRFLSMNIIDGQAQFAKTDP